MEGEHDAIGQMATVVVLKAVKSHFVDRKLRDGPFVLQLTDLHECNAMISSKKTAKSKEKQLFWQLTENFSIFSDSNKSAAAPVLSSLSIPGELYKLH